MSVFSNSLHLINVAQDDRSQNILSCLYKKLFKNFILFLSCSYINSLYINCLIVDFKLFKWLSNLNAIKFRHKN